MDLLAARIKANKTLCEHGLTAQGWTFDFDRAKYRLGHCRFDIRRVTISKHFTGVATEDEFEQALLHEIAHALLPVGAKHGKQWKEKAKEIGYRGKRLANNPYSDQLIKKEAEDVAKRMATLRKASNAMKRGRRRLEEIRKAPDTRSGA